MEDVDPTVDSNRYRQRVYDIIENEAFSYEERRDRLLEIGREFLSVENGHIE